MQKNYVDLFSHRNTYTHSCGCQIDPFPQVPPSQGLFLLQGVDNPQKGKSGEVTIAGVERANPVKLEDRRDVGIGYEVAPSRHLIGGMWTVDSAPRVRGNYVVNWGTASIYANAASTLAGWASFQFMTRNTPNGGTDQTSRCKNDDSQSPCIAGSNYNVSARSRHSGGVGVVMCDGAVRFVTDNVSLTTWQQLGNMNDGQTIADGF